MRHRTGGIGSAMGGALIGWVVGTGLQLQQTRLWWASDYGLLLAGGLALAVWGRRWLGPCVGWGLVFAGVAYASVGMRSLHYASGNLGETLIGVEVVLEGRVLGLPEARAHGWRLVVSPERAWRDDGRAVTLPPRLQLDWYTPFGTPAGDLSALPEVASGERWRWAVRLRDLRGLANPHGPDRELSAWRDGLGAQAVVRSSSRVEPPRRLAPAQGWDIERLREALARRVQARVPDAQAAGVMSALVVGAQRDIGAAQWEVFRRTGVAHLVSISGLHVTLFAWLAWTGVGALWRGLARLRPALALRWPVPRVAALGACALALAYARLAGWEVPAQRTVLMLCVVLALRQGGRLWPWPMVWLLALAVVVAWDPWSLSQPGFWLSFLAVGMLFARGEAPHAPGWRKSLAKLVRTQMVLSLALAPLTLLLFGQASVVGLLANLFSIPLVTMLITPLAMGGAVVAPLWDVDAWLVVHWLRALEHLAQWPWAILVRPAVPWPLGVLAVLGGALLAARLPPTWRLWGVLLTLPALGWTPPRPDPGAFEVLVVDVGQGSATLVRTRHHTLLVDAGPAWGEQSDAGQAVLLPLMQALGAAPQRLLLSHADGDHTGGAASVLQAFPDATLMANDAVTGVAATPVPCVRGARWRWDGVDFRVLHPDADWLAQAEAASATRAQRKTNNRSCVLRIESADGVRALLPGDIEQVVEARLLDQEAQALRAELLLLPHHGSKSSSSEPFIDAVAPRVVVAQAGYLNRFGHPAEPVRRRLQRLGVPLATSASCGAATWRSGQPQTLRCEREARRRYWHQTDEAIVNFP